MFTSDIVFSLVPIFCGCVLPIAIIWLTVERKRSYTSANSIKKIRQRFIRKHFDSQAILNLLVSFFNAG